VPDLGEFLVIGIVAMLVIPPERLPQAARSVGQWLGRMQQYVTQMREDVDRELHLADLKRITQEAHDQARSIGSSIQGSVSGVQAELNQLRQDATALVSGSNAGWSGGPPETGISFPKRYRPRPTIDDLTQEIERLKRQLAMPQPGTGSIRNRYAPRSRINRARVRR
jgi:sec-independent protein translocase protein TatB